MFRKAMLVATTVLMASSAFAAGLEKVDDAKRDKDKTERAADAKVETGIAKGKVTANQEKIFSIASHLVDTAAKDPANCDALCARTLQSLEVVVRGKDGLGLTGNLKPETAVIRIAKLSKTMTMNEAVRKVLEDQNIKQDSLLKCAGK